MNYELIKITTGYVLCEATNQAINLDNINSLKDLVKADKNKVVASTEVMEDKKADKLYKLDKVACDELFGLPETRQARASKKYLSASYGSHEQLKGISEVLRMQMYNYLSGRMEHEEFVKIYHDYERLLGELKIITVNGMPDDDEDGNWMPDNEGDDDEYFNDYIEGDHLKRPLPKRQSSRMFVTVSTLEDENGFVNLFPN